MKATAHVTDSNRNNTSRAPAKAHKAGAVRSRMPRKLPAREPALASPRAEKRADDGAGQDGAEPALTIIEANINVGFGNHLFIRGEGGGLSWEKGLPLVCVTDSIWVWSTESAPPELVFKLLLNDVEWAQSDDITVKAGQVAQVTPVFANDILAVS